MLSSPSPNSWNTHLSNKIAATRHADRLRRRGGVVANCIIDFDNNDYLNLRQHPDVIDALAKASAKWGWGSGASPVLSGHTRLHEELERELADLCDTDDALVFSSGYAANLGVMACLSAECDAIFSDQLNHACLIDGMRLSKAERFIYPHCNPEFLEQTLRERRADFGRCLIVSESLFSMDGDRAPLADLFALATKFDCGLVVDEAHATGIYGVQGGGLLDELSAEAPNSFTKPICKLGTLSKALGGIGGFATGSQVTVDFLVNHCRSFIFSTAPPPAAMLAALTAIRCMRSMHTERMQLRQRAVKLRESLRTMGFEVPSGDSPIIPVILGTEKSALRASDHLLRQQILVPAIRPPTVPADQSRLRISLSLRHTDEQLGTLLAALASL